MSSIEEIFRAAVLDAIGEQRGAQSRLAKAAGVHPPYLNGILKGNKPGTDDVRRAIADALGYPGRKYEDFLDIGRAITENRPRPEFEPRYLSADEMSERGFFTVPFSDNMKLAAGGGGTIPITDDGDHSGVIIHGPSLGRRSAKGLQAFRVGGDSMEPLIAEGGIVMVDTLRNDIAHIREGGIYVICWDLSDGECAVKRLRWAEKPRLLSIESHDPFYAPVFKAAKDVVLIGEVIWSWRKHGNGS